MAELLDETPGLLTHGLFAGGHETASVTVVVVAVPGSEAPSIMFPFAEVRCWFRPGQSVRSRRQRSQLLVVGA